MRLFVKVNILFVFFLIVYTLTAAAPVSAQATGVTLTPNKVSFSAHEGVVFTATSDIIDLATADIAWFVDTEEVAREAGMSAYRITLGDVGEVTTVAVAVYDGAEVVVAEDSLTVSPTSVALHWESDGYTHPFYRGRSLATPGTTVTVEARAFIVGEDGEPYPPESLYYTWKRNNRVEQHLSGLGASTISLTDLPPHNDTIVEVSVGHPESGARAENQTRIPSTGVRLLLYPVNPVLGIDFSHAAQSLFYPNELEKTFALIPQFAPIRTFFDPSLKVEWFVNGETVPSHSDNPARVTLIADSLGISAKLSSRIVPQNTYAGATEKTWHILFDDISSVINDLFSPEEEF